MVVIRSLRRPERVPVPQCRAGSGDFMAGERDGTESYCGTSNQIRLLLFPVRKRVVKLQKHPEVF